MKKIILTLATMFMFWGLTYAQDDQQSSVSLDSFERCNNWARHYCLNGNHDAVVNDKLLRLKKRGYIITTKLIRSYAQRTRANTPRAQKTN